MLARAALRARADLVIVGLSAGRWWSRTAGGERTLEGSYGQDCEPGKPVMMVARWTARRAWWPCCELGEQARAAHGRLPVR